MFISPSLKKYAKEKEMKISKGFVYGEIDGYMITVAEGCDIKILSISCKTCGNEKLAEYLEGLNLKKDYYIRDYKILMMEFRSFLMNCFLLFLLLLHLKSRNF